MKKFKFYIQSFNGASLEYLYVNSGGVVAFTATKTEIQYAPEGWAENGIELERGFTYYGLFTNYSKPLTFIRDGAQIIRWLFYNNFQSKTATLVVEMYNPNVAVTDYQTYYTGDIDLSTFKDNTTNDGCSCNIVQGGNNQLLKSKANIVYDVDITGMATKIKLEGIVQDGISRHSTVNNTRTDLFLPFSGGTDKVEIDSVYVDFSGYNNGKLLMYSVDGMAPVSNEGMVVNFGNTQTLKVDYTLLGRYRFVPMLNPPPVFGAVLTEITLTRVNILTGARVQTAIFSNATTTIDNTWIDIIPPAASTTITLLPFEKLTMEFQVTVTGTIADAPRCDFEFYDTNQILINSKSKMKATYCWAVRPLTLFKELIKKMTGSTVNGDSSVLQNNAFAKTILITTGDMIRGVNNMIIKTSFNSFFKSFNSILNLSCFITANGRIRVEPKTNVFLTSVGATIGCSKLKISPLTEQMFSSVKIGYPNKFNNDVNGKYEFNKERTLSVTNPRATQSLDLTSDYRADIYGIEEIRNTYTAIPFADTESNEDVFLVQILDTPFTDPIEGTYYKPFTAAGGILNNTSDPTNCYNFLISPMQNLRRHDNYLTSIFIEKLLVNESSSKTATSELTYTVGAVFIDEAADYTLVATPLFKPVVFEFDSAEQDLFYSTLLSAQFQQFQFAYNGNNYTGFLLKGKSIPSHLQKQEFRLLCGPSVNLNNLIN